MTTLMRLDTEAARFEPERVFAHPRDIVAEPGLTRGQKLATLRRWAADVEARLNAGAEGMSSTGTSAADATLLQEISQSIGLLNRELESEQSQPNPH